MQVGFKPDRKAVEAELMDHLQDLYAHNIEQGMDPKEAEQSAIAAMGDVQDIARQLGAIHNPFWGYALRVCQAIVVILLILSAIPLWDYATDMNLQDAPHYVSDLALFDPASYGTGTGRTLHHLSQPDVSMNTTAGKFTVTDAVVFSTGLTDSSKHTAQLFLQVRQRSSLPWMEHRKINALQLDSVTYRFFARDSLGNVYPCYIDGTDTATTLYSRGVQSGVFTQTCYFWINGFSSEAAWVELCYERDGHSYSLRVDLTGGAAQ